MLTEVAQNYLAFNEVNSDWPDLQFTAMFPASVKLDICPAKCPIVYAPRIRDDETIFAPDPLPEEDELPACSKDEPVKGIYLNRHPIDVIDPPTIPLTPRMGIRPLVGTFEFVPNLCRWKHGGRQFDTNHTACMEKRHKMLWTGDSHQRYALVGFDWRMNGHEDYYPYNDRQVSQLFSRADTSIQTIAPVSYLSYGTEDKSLSIDYRWCVFIIETASDCHLGVPRRRNC